MTPAKQGDSIQGLVGGQGTGTGPGGGGGAGGAPGGGPGGGWQSVAAGNGIEDPLRLKPGALVDLTLRADVAGGFGVSGALSAPAAIGARLPTTISIQPPRTQFGLS